MPHSGPFAATGPALLLTRGGRAGPGYRRAAERGQPPSPREELGFIASVFGSVAVGMAFAALSAVAVPGTALADVRARLCCAARLTHDLQHTLVAAFVAHRDSAGRPAAAASEDYAGGAPYVTPAALYLDVAPLLKEVCP